MQKCRISAALTTLLALLPAVLLLTICGCEMFEPKEPDVTLPKYAQTLSREEMLYHLQRNVQRLGTLLGSAQIVAYDQKQVVPATFDDAVLKDKGKAYQRSFNKRKLDGYLALDRSDPKIGPRVRFSAEVSGVGRVLQMLAVGDRFQVKMVKPNPKMGERRALLYFGMLDRDAPRPRKGFSMRPQDIIDLLVCREVLVSAPFAKAFFRETWPHYYILHVLRSGKGWPEHLYSKIWIERNSLTVAIHQIYDPSGELIAEARFSGHVKVGEGVDAVLVPLHIRYIWPRDRATIDVFFRRDTLKVNRKISETSWRPLRKHDADLMEIVQTSEGIKARPAPEK